MCGIWGGYCLDNKEIFRLSIIGQESNFSRGQQGWGVALIDPVWRQIDTYHYVPETDLDKVQQEEKERKVWGRVKDKIYKMKPSLFLGATRYTTDAHSSLEEILKNPTGAKNRAYANTQPIYIEHRGVNLLDKGIGGENGNCPPAGKAELEERILIKSDHIADVDIRLMTEYFMQLLRSTGDHFVAAEQFVENVFGVYSFMYSDGKTGITLFQDRNGVRPLWFGRDRRKSKKSVLFSSETEYFNRLQTVEIIEEAKPGWAYHISHEGDFSKKKLDVSGVRHLPCPFEDEYQKKTNSLVTGGKMTTAKWRVIKGTRHANKYYDELKDIDYVAGVARSGRGVGFGAAYALNKPYIPVIEKFEAARYYLLDSEYGFVDGGSADHKWTVEKTDITGYDILVTEDSVIRGRTLVKLLINMLEYDPKMLRVLVSWPVNLFGCDKGNDTDDMQLLGYRLIKEGVLDYKEDGTVSYEIETVNKYMSMYLKEHIEEAIPVLNKKRLQEDLMPYSIDKGDKDTVYLDLDKLKFYFGEVSDLEALCGKNICKTCLTGEELPGWDKKKRMYEESCAKAQNLL